MCTTLVFRNGFPAFSRSELVRGIESRAGTIPPHRSPPTDNRNDFLCFLFFFFIWRQRVGHTLQRRPGEINPRDFQGKKTKKEQEKREKTTGRPRHQRPRVCVYFYSSRIVKAGGSDKNDAISRLAFLREKNPFSKVLLCVANARANT